MSTSRVGVGVVDVSEWQPDADNPIFPIGSQPKRLLLCPARPNDARLIPGHQYLFKVPIEWKAQQVWSEVIASRLGEHLGVSVPRCFIGKDAEGKVGALVEFFYGHPGQISVPRFVHASDLLRTTIDNPKLGKSHHMDLCRIFAQAYPEAGIVMRQMLNFETSRVVDVLRACVETITNPPFTEARARFVAALLKARTSRLQEALGA
ncbi:MAG: hypothetical protein WB902_23040 [Acetobacteraceae bacterium]|jgi:hypothetical protein